MYDVKSESSTAVAVCCGCLSTDRTLFPLTNYELYYSLLGNNQNFEELKCFDLLLCWECTALLQNTATFRNRLQNAQCILKLAHDKKITATSLSTLKSSHRQGYDYTIKETIEEKPDIDVFTDNCSDLDIKQEINFDHFDIGYDINYSDEKVAHIKKEKKHVKPEKRSVLKIDNGFDFNKLELYFTKVRLSETEVQESLAQERDDNDCVSRPLKCGVCGYRFASKTELHAHKKENHNKRRQLIKCPLCGTRHSSRPDLMLHWRRSHPVNRCSCCARVVERDADRTKHLHQHRFSYQCEKCNVQFPDRLLYVEHSRRLHTQYVCDHCGRSAARKRTLERHIVNNHLPHKCVVCGRVFSSHERLARHARAAHAPPDAGAYCVECDASFPTRAKYARHLSTAVRHRPKKKESIPCPECGKIFSRKNYMKNHVKLFHTNDSKHHCAICDKYFVTGFALRSHNKYVHEKMPKPKTKICNVCGRGFGTNRVLENHMRTHTGERPFACARCSAAFAQQVALRAHRAAIHKEK